MTTFKGASALGRDGNFLCFRALLATICDDPAVPVENSLLYVMALRKNKVPFALHIFPHGRHGLGLAANVPEARQWPALCAEWLKGLGFTGK